MVVCISRVSYYLTFINHVCVWVIVSNAHLPYGVVMVLARIYSLSIWV